MPKAPIGSLLLDTYPNAAVAYSLRKLRTAYTGSAIRVRRFVDNAEQDFGFDTNGDLDTAPMLDFVGYNLWTYSEDISNALYIKGGLNTTGTPPYIDQATAPDGTLTGDKLIESTNNGQHIISRSTVVLLNGVSYNFSVFVKQAERTKIYVGTNISGASVFCDIDLTNGTISNNGLSNTPIVTAEANGWYRVSFNLIGLGSSAGVSVGLLNASNQRIYVGNNTSGAYVWGFQISQSSTVKLYQKTVINAGGNGFIARWYDQSINNNHAEQFTLLASQAQIVSNGNLILDVDTGKITSNWTGDRYDLTTGISTNTQYFSISMWRRGANAVDSLTHLGNAVGNSPTPLWWAGSGTAFSVRSYMSTLYSYENISTIGRCIITSLRDSTNLKVAYRNGVQLALTSIQAPQVGTLTTFGQLGTTLYTSGQYQEYIYWDSDKSANRVAIETNINDYWNAF